MSDKENISLEDLHNNNFQLVLEVNDRYKIQNQLKSGKNDYKAIYYNEETKEVKAIERQTLRSKDIYLKEIDLNVIRNLEDEHPLKKIITIIDSPAFKNTGLIRQLKM